MASSIKSISTPKRVFKKIIYRRAAKIAEFLLFYFAVYPEMGEK